MSYATRRLYGVSAVKSYAAIGLETEVLSASPQRLITLLFDASRASIAQARMHFEEGRDRDRMAALSKAIRIVSEGLQQSLNMEAGGEIANNLNRLYDYIVRSLLAANRNKDLVALNIADRLLADLQGAWKTSVDRAANPVPDL
jgi:flagellar protein FliS